MAVYQENISVKAQEDLANQTLSSAEISVMCVLMTMMMSASTIVLCPHTNHVMENVKKMDAKINVDTIMEAGMEPGNYLVLLHSIQCLLLIQVLCCN